MHGDRVRAAALLVEVAAETARGERRGEFVNGREWVEVKIDDVYPAARAGRVLRLQAVREVDRATERIEGSDHRVAEERHVVLPPRVGVTTDPYRPLRIGHVEDACTGTHRADKGVVVDHAVVVGPRLEL